MDKNNYIGISEDRLHHIIGVARECYQIAKTKGYDEDFCRRMFMIGWNHDTGYEFCEEATKHPAVSEELLKLIGVTSKNMSTAKVLHCIRKHGHDTNTKSPEWIILNTADLTIDSYGDKVDVLSRLEDIKKRYGENSPQYEESVNIAKCVGLLKA